MNIFEQFSKIKDPENFHRLETESFQNLPVHLYSKDCNGFYLSANAYQAIHSGLQDRFDMIGKSDFDLSWSSYAHILRKNDSEAMLLENSKIFFEAATIKNDKLLLAISYKSPLYTPSQKIAGMMGMSIVLYHGERSGIDTLAFQQFCDKNPFHNFLPLIASNATPLTKRQEDCLFYLTIGMTKKEIAKNTQLSPKTVEHYLDAVKIKLNCHNRSELIKKALNMICIQHRLKVYLNNN